MRSVVVMFMILMQLCVAPSLNASQPETRSEAPYRILEADGDGNTELHRMAISGQGDLQKLLNTCSFDDLAAKNNAGETALHLAVTRKRIKFITAVLKRLSEYANAYDQLQRILLMGDNEGNTPLHLAAFMEDAKVILAILAPLPRSLYRQLLKAQNNAKRTPYDLVTQNSDARYALDNVSWFPLLSWWLS